MITKEQAFAYALMDRYGVIYGKNGCAAGLFVLGVELYVAPREITQLRLDMLDVQEDYWRRFNAHLDNMLYETEKEGEDNGLRFRLKKSENPFPWVRQAIGHPSIGRGYCNVIRSAPAHPDFSEKSKFSISAWKSLFFAKDKREYPLSYHVASIPVSDGNGGLHFDIWRDCVLTWAKRLRPAHGLAGLTVVMSDTTNDGPYIHPTLKKYIGLDVQVPLDFSMKGEGVFNRIKCVNWLTVLGDALLEELGGLAALKGALEPECTLHPYPGGVMIQAGEAPRLGDVDVPGSSELLEPYRKVARVTKPVRFTDYPKGSLLFGVDESLNGAEEAKKWVSRFD